MIGIVKMIATIDVVTIIPVVEGTQNLTTRTIEFNDRGIAIGEWNGDFDNAIGDVDVVHDQTLP